MKNYLIKDNLVKSLNGMGIGLFATLVVGTILSQIGTLAHWDLLVQLGTTAKVLMGGAIGAGVAYSLGAPPLVIFSCIVTGSIGAGAVQVVDANTIIKVGDPAGAYAASLITALAGKKIAGRTKVDIILVPIVCILIGGITGTFISPVVTQFTSGIGYIINRATELQPLYMGAIVSTVMGLVLVSPISSAALAASLGLSGLAAGAAVVGTSCQMIGFAVGSYKENGIEGIIAQGLGTAKIQFGNIVRNPLIAVPSTLASFILGMVSTTVFKMTANKIGAGMGTSGLVGQIQTIAEMGSGSIVKIIILHFILPAVISFSAAYIMKKKGYIKDNDMVLPSV